MRSATFMANSMKQLFYREEGMSFIECALLASLAAVVGGIAVLALNKP